MLSPRRSRMTAYAAEMPRIFARVPAERLARACGKTLRSVNRWLEGTTQPSAVDLMHVFREFPDLITEVAEVAGHKVVTQAQYDAAKRALKILEGS